MQVSARAAPAGRTTDMKRIAAGALAVVLGLLGAHRLAAGRARAVDGVTATSMPTSATAPHRDPVLGERLPSVLGPTAIDAELRSARATLNDQAVTSATVDVSGVYPDALDQFTLTVVCVAHRATVNRRPDEPCATTVTIAPTPDGRLVVVAVR